MGLEIEKRGVKSVVIRFDDGMEMLATGPFVTSRVVQRSERELNKPLRRVWQITFTEGPAYVSGDSTTEDG